MVPSLLRQVVELPLTANGKVDTDQRSAPTPAAPTGAPTAELRPAERRVAAAWAEVLDVPLADIGPDAHFADLGGTSLTAVRLVVALDRAVTLREVRTHPVLADLARLHGRSTAMTTTQTLDATPTVNGVHVVRVGTTDPDVWTADDNRMRVRHLAAEHGAVLLRGFGVENPADAAAVLTSLGGELMTEREAFAARAPLGHPVSTPRRPGRPPSRCASTTSSAMRSQHPAS